MDPFQKFYDRALRFLSYRPRSEKEIRDYLRRHSGKPKAHPESREREDDSGQVPPQRDPAIGGARMTIIDRIVAKLKEQDLVNDGEFTKWWIEQRQGSKPRGWRIIKMELKQKGIPEDKIQNSITANAGSRCGGKFKIQNEKELAKKAIEKKIVLYEKLPRDKIYQKLSQFLLRRGFEWETVKEVIDEVLKKE